MSSDHFYRQSNGGPGWAGRHVIVDFWGCRADLTDEAQIRQALAEAAKASRAELLQVVTHTFPEGGGVTGLALLAESHIAIHTWPEWTLAAVDIFTCGQCDPYAAAAMIQDHLRPLREDKHFLMRGRAETPK